MAAFDKFIKAREECCFCGGGTKAPARVTKAQLETLQAMAEYLKRIVKEVKDHALKQSQDAYEAWEAKESTDPEKGDEPEAPEDVANAAYAEFMNNFVAKFVLDIETEGVNEEWTGRAARVEQMFNMGYIEKIDDGWWSPRVRAKFPVHGLVERNEKYFPKHLVAQVYNKRETACKDVEEGWKDAKGTDCKWYGMKPDPGQDPDLPLRETCELDQYTDSQGQAQKSQIGHVVGDRVVKSRATEDRTDASSMCCICGGGLQATKAFQANVA
jgi:hypothetical protein